MADHEALLKVQSQSPQKGEQIPLFIQVKLPTGPLMWATPTGHQLEDNWRVLVQPRSELQSL